MDRVATTESLTVLLRDVRRGVRELLGLPFREFKQEMRAVAELCERPCPGCGDLLPRSQNLDGFRNCPACGYRAG